MSFSAREELLKAFNERLRDDEEGLVVKKHDMKYKPNVRNGGGCYKIKAEVKNISIFIIINILKEINSKRNLIYDKKLHA